MLALFSSSTMINACAWICFAPIFSLIQEVYGVSLFTVNYLSWIFMIMMVPVYIPSVIAIDKYGLRTSLLIGIIGTAIGCWVRSLIE